MLLLTSMQEAWTKARFFLGLIVMHCCHMLRHVNSMNETLALIFADTLKADQGESSDENHDSEVDNDSPPSPKQCWLAVESSDSLPTGFPTSIRQDIQRNPDPLDLRDVSTTAFEVSIGAEPVSVVSTTTKSSVAEVVSYLKIKNYKSVALILCPCLMA